MFNETIMPAIKGNNLLLNQRYHLTGDLVSPIAAVFLRHALLLKKLIYKPPSHYQLVVGTVEKVEVFHTRPLSNLPGQGTFGSDTDNLV